MGDILEPKVTRQRIFVHFDTMFLIVKTMTKYLLGMYIMTDITYMINKRSKIVFLYIRYENVPSYYVSNMCNYDHLKSIFGLILILRRFRTMSKYLLGMYIVTDITYMINKHSKIIFLYELRKCT